MQQAASASADYEALTQRAAFFDISNRGRLCLVGSARQTFINGQVTNNVKDLRVGEGCYAALVNNKGKMISDLNIFVLENEILLDFEPALVDKVKDRLEKFIIAEDVQIIDASTSYGLITVQGPDAISAVESKRWSVPQNHFHIREQNSWYIANVPRLGVSGVDIYFPMAELHSLDANGSIEAFEIARVERGIPRFGVDMDENTLAPEALGQNAISYSKGCYIGQEVIARIRTYGQVAKALRSLAFEPSAPIPKSGDKIRHDGKEVGWITSAVFSPKLERPIALSYVRKECNQIGTRLLVNDNVAEIV